MTTTEQTWLVLEYFADPNLKDTTGNTALHYACKANNRGIILTLLLFGANPDIPNNEEKKPFELSSYRKEDEIDPILEKINKYKIHFISLTRKRRNRLKKIFDDIDNDQSKSITDYKLKSFNEWLNGETEEEAIIDARLFMENAKLFKTEEILYEEFIIAMAAIVYNYKIKAIDEFIDKYRELSKTKKRKNDDF